MPLKSPWHSKLKTRTKVYHDNTACTDGNSIEDRYRVAGTGDRPKCYHCVRLAAQGK